MTLLRQGLGRTQRELLMDVDRLQAIIDWMQRSPLRELEIADGDFRARLVRAGGSAVALAVTSDVAEPISGTTINAPSYGIVHLASAPGATPFVDVGAEIVPGQPLCVLEAMKVFTPLEAEKAGKLIAILVADGAEVSAGQPLFRLD